MSEGAPALGERATDELGEVELGLEHEPACRDEAMWSCGATKVWNA